MWLPKLIDNPVVLTGSLLAPAVTLLLLIGLVTGKPNNPITHNLPDPEPASGFTYRWYRGPTPGRMILRFQLTE